MQTENSKSYIYPVVDKRANKRGYYTVYVMFRLAGKFYRVSTGLRSPEFFTGLQFPASDPYRVHKTQHLCAILSAGEDYLLTHRGEDAGKTREALITIITGVERKPKLKRVVDYVEEFANTKIKPGTRALYRTTANRLREYDETLTWERVTLKWLNEYHRWLIETRGMKINSAALDLRNLRAVNNWLINNEVLTSYPFRRFKIPHERTRKRSLTIEQLATLRDYPVEEWQREYRDMFMLSFYLIGINIGDLLQLPKLTDGRCVYHRNKTGRLYDIEVQPEALEIIERYRGEGQLLSPLDRYNDYHYYIQHLNSALKKIGDYAIVPDKVGKRRKIEYHPLFPELSSYWARHTWATIAARLDIPKETIGKALGHSDWDNTTTDIYIDFDTRKIDEANRKVIDALNNQCNSENSK